MPAALADPVQVFADELDSSDGLMAVSRSDLLAMLRIAGYSEATSESAIADINVLADVSELVSAMGLVVAGDLVQLFTVGNLILFQQAQMDLTRAVGKSVANMMDVVRVTANWIDELRTLFQQATSAATNGRTSTLQVAEQYTDGRIGWLLGVVQNYYNQAIWAGQADRDAAISQATANATRIAEGLYQSAIGVDENFYNRITAERQQAIAAVLQQLQAVQSATETEIQQVQEVAQQGDAQVLQEGQAYTSTQVQAESQARVAGDNSVAATAASAVASLGATMATQLQGLTSRLAKDEQDCMYCENTPVNRANKAWGGLSGLVGIAEIIALIAAIRHDPKGTETAISDAVTGPVRGMTGALRAATG